MPSQSFAKFGMDDLVASATDGVLRALEARRVNIAGIAGEELVRSGFLVEIILRAGGWPLPDVLKSNPMPGRTTEGIGG